MKLLAAIALVLIFGVPARLAYPADGRRTPVEIHVLSLDTRCDAVGSDFVAGLNGVFSAESLAISGSIRRVATPNHFRRAPPGERASVTLFLTLQSEGSAGWSHPQPPDTTTSYYDQHLLITGSFDRRHLFWTTTRRFRSRLWSGDMGRADFCWRSGRNIGLIALEALHRDRRAMKQNEQLALMPIVKTRAETEWVRKASQKRKRNVLTDTTLTFHWKPGVWFMHMRVDCDREDGMEAVISDPKGKALCPLLRATWGTQVANKCDCMALAMGPREGSPGLAFVSTSSWRPKRNPYRIRVKGLAPCRIVVSVGAQYSSNPHWAVPDTVNIGQGEELAWTATWGSATTGDSTRVTLQRIVRSNQ